MAPVHGNETQGKVESQGGPDFVEAIAADVKDDFEPYRNVSDNARDVENGERSVNTQLTPRNGPSTTVNTSLIASYSNTVADQVSTMPSISLHDQKPIILESSDSQAENDTSIDVTRTIDRIRLPAISENDEDDYIFTMATPSLGFSRSTTLYVIYEADQEYVASRNEGGEESESDRDDEDNLTATKTDSNTEIDQTTIYDVGNHRLSSVQQTKLAHTKDQSNIITVSPYRENTYNRIQESQRSVEEKHPRLIFSKQLLIWMDHDKEDLEIDLFRPSCLKHVYPVDVLSPLCLYRKLRTLKIMGMMRSYQAYIWLVVWLNPYISKLTLEMANNGEVITNSEIARARSHAKSKPSLSEVTQGQKEAAVFQKIPIIKLRLTNFMVDATSFGLFNRTRLQEVELRQCKVPNDILEKMERMGFINTKVTLVG